MLAPEGWRPDLGWRLVLVVPRATDAVGAPAAARLGGDGAAPCGGGATPKKEAPEEGGGGGMGERAGLLCGCRERVVGSLLWCGDRVWVEEKNESAGECLCRLSIPFSFVHPRQHARLPLLQSHRGARQEASHSLPLTVAVLATAHNTNTAPCRPPWCARPPPAPAPALTLPRAAPCRRSASPRPPARPPHFRPNGETWCEGSV